MLLPSYQMCYIPYYFTPLLIPSTIHVPLPPISHLLRTRNSPTHYLSHHHMHVYLTILLQVHIEVQLPLVCNTSTLLLLNPPAALPLIPLCLPATPLLLALSLL
jgi:hypothetical protein